MHTYTVKPGIETACFKLLSANIEYSRNTLCESLLVHLFTSTVVAVHMSY